MLLDAVSHDSDPIAMAHAVQEDIWKAISVACADPLLQGEWAEYYFISADLIVSVIDFCILITSL